MGNLEVIIHLIGKGELETSFVIKYNSNQAEKWMLRHNVL